MKRFLLLSLAIMLVSALILGGCSAPTPPPAPTPTPTPAPIISAQELIGVGMLGRSTWVGQYRNELTGEYDIWAEEVEEWDTHFIVTNPNSHRQILITHLRIIREDGVMVYEEPMQKVLTPHEIMQFTLSGMLDIIPLDITLTKFTVAIIWECVGAATCHELTGWFKEIKHYDGIDYEYNFPYAGAAISEAEMKNFPLSDVTEEEDVPYEGPGGVTTVPETE